ncbi:MAG TPA: glycine cleavage T C-terminal barrel domain-containing protein [Pyrinomonadaceae bacterium]|nr:glycine cleavage T C-terminal barrel domain-containing protein [Pyrinomonadaceae bacterium]
MTKAISFSEYTAVRDGGAGLFDQSSRGRILVSGSEAVMFLNGLITNDMKSLAVNSWMAAAFANVQGRLLAAVRIAHREDGFLIDTESATRETVITLLDRFTLAGDFHLQDLTDETAMFSVQGRRASEVISRVFGAEAASAERHKLVNAQFGNMTVNVIRATHTAEDGFDLFIEANNSLKVGDALTAAGAAPISNATFETLRIEAGVPFYGIDMDENNVVTETNLDDAVSFTKGCYLGQEIIVRIKHRGHVAKKLSGVVLDDLTPVPRNSKIISSEGKEIGRVTSSVFSPPLDRAIALGYLKYDYLAAGTEVKVAAPERETNATVADLPFVRGSWYA